MVDAVVADATAEVERYGDGRTDVDQVIAGPTLSDDARHPMEHLRPLVVGTDQDQVGTRVGRVRRSLQDFELLVDHVLVVTTHVRPLAHVQVQLATGEVVFRERVDIAG